MLLAKWYYSPEEIYNIYDINNTTIEIDFNKDENTIFNPYEKLDAFDDKMLEELGNEWDEAAIGKYEGNYYYRVLQWMADDVDETLVYGTGKTKNDAKLDAIVNYVKSLDFK